MMLNFTSENTVPERLPKLLGHRETTPSTEEEKPLVKEHESTENKIYKQGKI